MLKKQRSARGLLITTLDDPLHRHPPGPLVPDLVLPPGSHRPRTPRTGAITSGPGPSSPRAAGARRSQVEVIRRIIPVEGRATLLAGHAHPRPPAALVVP